MADVNLVFVAGREVLDVPRSGVLSLTRLSREPPLKAAQTINPGLGCRRTDRHRDAELAQLLCSKDSSRWVGWEHLAL